MSISTQELAQARELVGQLLEALGLDAYLFEVEPGESRWDVRVECAVQGGWTTCELQVEKRQLLDGVGDAAVRQALLDDWRRALSDCLRES